VCVGRFEKCVVLSTATSRSSATVPKTSSTMASPANLDSPARVLRANPTSSLLPPSLHYFNRYAGASFSLSRHTTDCLLNTVDRSPQKTNLFQKLVSFHHLALLSCFAFLGLVYPASPPIVTGRLLRRSGAP
jgi:hypothetical protein